MGSGGSGLRFHSCAWLGVGWLMRLSERMDGWGKAAAMTALLSLFACPPALAIDVELNDVAADRVERQRAYTRGQLPLPSTPDLERLDGRLAVKGLAKGREIFIRIFKASSELEIWMQRETDKAFVLLDTYPICHWTGTLGPKLREGDRQSPEGFYSVSNRQMRLIGRWQKAFNIGYPNTHDQLNKRTGSFILVHGGCSSVGCFAMTEQVQEEIFLLAKAAVTSGQEKFHVQIFPFRMTDEAMAVHAGHAWAGFWRELKAGFDSFERTHLPPKIAICEQRYHVTDGEPGDIGDVKPMSILRPGTVRTLAGAAPVCLTDAQRAAVQTTVIAAAAEKIIDAVKEPEPTARRKPDVHKRAGQSVRGQKSDIEMRPAEARPAPGSTLGTARKEGRSLPEAVDPLTTLSGG